MTASPKVRVIRIPMKLPSLANARGCWQGKAREIKRQRGNVALYFNATDGGKPALPVTVTLIRYGPRMLDTDNLAISFKGVRDEIAKQYGVDDGSNQYEWEYRQAARKECGIEIRIESTVPY